MWDIYVYFSLLALNLGLWAIGYKRLHTALKVLGAALLVTFLIEGYAALLLLQMTSNLYVYHLLTPVQYALYALVMFNMFEGAKTRKAVLFSVPVYMLIALLITLRLQSTDEFNSYALAMKHVLIAGWCLLYYREVFTGLRIIRLGRDPLFWVCTGLLFHSLGNFFNDSLMNYSIGQSYELAHTLFYISVMLGFLLYATFIVAFLLSKKQSNVALLKGLVHENPQVEFMASKDE